MKERINGEIKEVSSSGNSNEDGGLNIEYLDVSKLNLLSGGNKNNALVTIAYLIKLDHPNMGNSSIIPSSFNLTGTTNIYAIAVDFMCNLRLPSYPLEKDNVTCKELAILMGGWSEEELAAIPRITKEQFYSLE